MLLLIVSKKQAFRNKRYSHIKRAGHCKMTGPFMVILFIYGESLLPTDVPAGILLCFDLNFSWLTFVTALTVHKRRSSFAFYRSLCEACAYPLHSLCEATCTLSRTNGDSWSTPADLRSR